MVNARDVTDRRRAEEALRLRDRAVAAATDGILIADAAQPDWPVIGVNPGFERITGYPAAEILGHNGRFLQGPGTERAAVAEIRRALEESRKCTVTLLNCRKDGTPFGNELRLAPVRDEAGQLTHVVGVQSDVTERKRAEAALGAAEAKYRTLVEQMPAITYVTAREAPGTPWRVRYMSPQIAPLRGRDL